MVLRCNITQEVQKIRLLDELNLLKKIKNGMHQRSSCGTLLRLTFITVHINLILFNRRIRTKFKSFINIILLENSDKRENAFRTDRI